MNHSANLEKLLKSKAKDFAAVGLVYCGRQEDSLSSESRFTDFVFKNGTSQIGLQISISEKNGSISTFISHPTKRGFSLRQYLIFHRRKREYDNDFFRASAEKYVELLNQLILKDWHPLILGTRWYNIPFDWRGYK